MKKSNRKDNRIQTERKNNIRLKRDFTDRSLFLLYRISVQKGFVWQRH